MEIDKVELEFKQQVKISPMNLFVKDLWDRIFTEGYVPPPEDGDTGGPSPGTFFPATADEFAQMVEEFEMEERGVYQSEL